MKEIPSDRGGFRGVLETGHNTDSFVSDNPIAGDQANINRSILARQALRTRTL